jgi:hypothetical protein
MDFLDGLSLAFKSKVEMSKKNFSVGCQGAESFLFFNFLKNFV